MSALPLPPDHPHSPVAAVASPIAEMMRMLALRQGRPFRAGERRPNPDGSYSTEITTTVPRGPGWTNIPTLWMTPKGPVELREVDAMRAAAEYARRTNAYPAFYPDLKSAVSAAEARTHGGGVAEGPLFIPRP